MILPGLLHATATRYVQPLREGGSLPAVVDTGHGLFVVKFRGAGQGPRALAAELIVGRLAAAMGLPVPALALVDVPASFGRSEPDPEIQDLLRASHGANVGLRYLDGAFNFASQAAAEVVTAEFASRLVWLDAFVTNPDRTDRNPNLLVWNRQPWLIDHGAALYVHYDWAAVDDVRIRAPFPLIAQHVLLRDADRIASVDRDVVTTLTEPLIRDVLQEVPDELLAAGDGTADVLPADARERYIRYLTARLAAPRSFVSAALDARARLLTASPVPLAARR